MAKGKKGSGTHYTSKGERKNVSRWSKLAARRERKANPTVKDALKSYHHRQQIMNAPKTPKEKELAARYAEQDRIESQAYPLLEQYGSVGLQRGEAIMAVKTSHLERLHAKYSARLKQAESRKNAK